MQRGGQSKWLKAIIHHAWAQPPPRSHPTRCMHPRAAKASQLPGPHPKGPGLEGACYPTTEDSCGHPKGALRNGRRPKDGRQEVQTKAWWETQAQRPSEANLALATTASFPGIEKAGATLQEQKLQLLQFCKNCLASLADPGSIPNVP